MLKLLISIFVISQVLSTHAEAATQYPSPTYNTLTLQNPLAQSNGGTGANTQAGALAAVVGAPTVVTTTGSISVLSSQSTILWQPITPANTTFTLPASPGANEIHTFYYQSPQGAYPMTITPAAGQSIVYNGTTISYWNLVNYGDTVQLRYLGSNQWGVF